MFRVGDLVHLRGDLGDWDESNIWRVVGRQVLPPGILTNVYYLYYSSGVMASLILSNPYSNSLAERMILVLEYERNKKIEVCLG